jgi:hypothetical protein
MRVPDGSDNGTDSVHHILCKSREKFDGETLAMISQAFGEESVSRMWGVQTHWDRNRRDRRRAKSRACSSFSLTSNSLFTKTGQTVNSTYSCDVLQRLREHERRLRPELWRQKNCLLHHDNAASHTSPLSGNFWLKQHDCRPPPTLLFFVSPIADKTERPPFSHSSGDGGRMQAVLNTLTEHDSQDGFTKRQKLWERCTRTERDYFEGDGGQ